MDQKSWPDRPKPLIYMNEKDWKKDGLNPPVFPLGWPHVANSFSPGATSGATAWCAHHVYAWMRVCVCVCVRAPVRVGVRVVVSCSRGCTRGGLEGRLSVIV